MDIYKDLLAPRVGANSTSPLDVDYGQSSIPVRSLDDASFTKAKSLLTKAIEDRRASAIHKLLDREPSLAFTSLRCSILAPGVADPAPKEIPFVEAAIRTRCLSAISKAVEIGFDINAPLRDRPLLHVAVGMEDAAVVSEILRLGANASAPCRKSDLKPALLSAAINSQCIQGDTPDFTIALMLLDARVPAREHLPGHPSPVLALISSDQWSSPATRPLMLRMITHLYKAGCDMDSPSGQRNLTPIRAAMGARNWFGVHALILAGADLAPEIVGGDIYEIAAANKASAGELADIRAALMTRVAHDATRSLIPPTEQTSADTVKPSPTPGTTSPTDSDVTPQPDAVSQTDRRRRRARLDL